MSERKPDRGFLYVQLRVPNDTYPELERVATEDRRTIHAELLAMVQTWTKLPRHRRLAIEQEAELAT